MVEKLTKKLELEIKVNHRILVLIFFSFFINQHVFSEINNSKNIKTYQIENKILKISNNGFVDEIYLCDFNIQKCKLIDKAWSFVAFAKKCDGIDATNIYFAQKKEYFFKGGINENAPLRIYDLDGNIYGTSPNIKYAKPWCEFIDEIK